VGARPPFEIDEQEEDEHTRLRVAGELDMATAPVLENRLKQLRAARLQEARQDRRWVVLDLSRLEFIDSTGVKVLFQAIHYARSDGWQVELRGDLSSQVKQVVELTQLDRYWRPR